MKELKSERDLFDIPDRPDCAVCVTTNGVIKKDSTAVMGAGIAKACAYRFPDTPAILGALLKQNGNHAFNLGYYQVNDVNCHIFSFPTKTHWRLDSDPELIRQSCREVKKLCDDYHIRTCYLPRPGCTNGHLDYDSQVRPILSSELDDRFVILLHDNS